MTITSQETTIGALYSRLPKRTPGFLRARAHRRLTAVFEAASEISFDDRSRLIFFSDCHRGDNSRTDSFARNEDLFVHALDYYHRQGFEYVEVGDGDEMWKNKRHDDIVRAHPRAFDMLHQFSRQDRLHLIVGNHDIRGYRHKKVEKSGVTAAEGLIFRHSGTGRRIFAVHGHQADFKSDALPILSRMMVRHVWRRLQLLDFESIWRHAHAIWHKINGRTHRAARRGFLPLWISKIAQFKSLCAERIMSWAEANQQLVICGHTHRPMAPVYGGVPYFNAGSCVAPGMLTGLEIQNGEIALVKWSSPAGTRIRREFLAPPRKLDQI